MWLYVVKHIPEAFECLAWGLAGEVAQAVCWGDRATPTCRVSDEFLFSGSAGTSRREGRDGRCGSDGEWHWLVETRPWWLVAVLVDVCVFSGLNGSSSPRVPQVPPAPEDPPELQVLTGRKAPQVE